MKRVLGWTLALLLIGAALGYLHGQLPEVRRVARSVHPAWGLVAGAAALVLCTYALLIEGWRRTLAALGGHLSPARAAAIWLGSNLARYLPLSGWQLGAMSLMAQRQSVPVAVSAGASVLITIVNLFSGLAVFIAASASAPTLSTGGRWFVAAGVLALGIAPFLLPQVERLGSRITGRTIMLPRMSGRPVMIAAIATTAAWILYGVAFWVLAHALLPTVHPPLSACIAIYVGSYLAGLIAFLPPAGLGVAEGAMLALSAQLGTFSPVQAGLLAIVVRVGRTLLEIVPGVIALSLAAIHDRRAPDADFR